MNDNYIKKIYFLKKKTMSELKALYQYIYSPCNLSASNILWVSQIYPYYCKDQCHLKVIIFYFLLEVRSK